MVCFFFRASGGVVCSGPLAPFSAAGWQCWFDGLRPCGKQRSIPGMDSPHQESQRRALRQENWSTCVPQDVKMLSLFSLLLLVRRVCVKNTESALKVWVINFCSSSENTETKQDQLRPKPHQRGFYRTHTQSRTGCRLREGISTICKEMEIQHILCSIPCAHIWG